jgi:hypothetical protein
MKSIPAAAGCCAEATRHLSAKIKLQALEKSKAWIPEL